MEKIGIGIITCNRQAMFRKCVASVPDVDVLVVVNDGERYAPSSYPSRLGKVIQHDRRKGVASSKNDALRFLLENGCRHIFLVEDDVRIINPSVCREYILAAASSGILHLNFGYHGPRNKTPEGIPDVRMTADYGDGVSLGFNRHLVGAFSYYRSDVLESCGLIDTSFKNALDHVEHTYRIIQRGYHTPFWWFADLAESWRSIEDMDPDLSKSTIPSVSWWSTLSFRASNLRFRLKHGQFVQHIPEESEEQVRRVIDSFRIGLRERSGD